MLTSCRRWFVWVLGCLCVSPALAQTSFPGLSGFTFTEADTAYTLAVTEDLTGLGLSIAPTDLTFRYTPGTGGADYQLALFGEVKATFEESTLDLMLGDAGSPGVTATGTTLEAFAATVSGTFSLKSLGFEADTAGLQWQAATDSLGIYGTFVVRLEEDSLTVVMGSTDMPGMIVENGTVTALNLDLPDTLSLKGLPLTPSDLGMAWTGTDDAFAIWGTATLTIDDSTWTATVGHADDPGITIDDGSLTQLALQLDGSLDLDGFEAEADSLTIDWDADEDEIELSGSGTITLGQETLAFTLGDAADPGVTLQNGQLVDLDLSLTGTLTAASMALVIDSLTLLDRPGELFEAYGGVSVAVGSDTMSVALGDSLTPGMVFTSGALTSFAGAVSGTVALASVDFVLDSLAVQWMTDSDFELYGGLALDLDSDTITVTAGDADDPGLKINNGELTHFNVGITADFELHGLEIAPQDLTFEWDEPTATFFMYGELDVSFAGDTVDALLGTVDDPGLTVANGSITEVNMGITSDFKVEGLEIKTDSLTFQWQEGGSYDLFGEAALYVDEDSLDAVFGDAANPGIQVTHGELESLSVGITSDLKLGNLEVQTVNLTVDYANDLYVVSGEVIITEVFELDVTLGTTQNPGLEIDVSGASPRFKIEDLKIVLEHADLGGIDIKNITLEFTQAGIKDVEVDVAFPGGTEIGGEMTFVGDPATIDDVTVFYRADNLFEALTLFEGVQIAYIEGSVQNLAREGVWVPGFGINKAGHYTQSPYVSVTLQTIYGGGVTFGGESATFLEMEDDLSIYDFGVQFDADLNLGAYRNPDDSNNWSNILGSGNVEVILDYGNYGYLSADLHLPFVSASASVYTDSHKDFDALVNVQFCFPDDSWPVSNDCFGSLSGAVRYKHGAPYASYGAGWMTWDLWWDTYYPGGQYNFGSESFSFHLDLDAGSIINQIHTDEGIGKGGTGSTTSYTHHTSTFDLEVEGAHSLFVRMNWHELVDSAYVTVIGPDGYHELMEAYVAEEGAAGEPPTVDARANFDLVTNDSLANFFILTATTVDSSDAANEALLPGTYTIYLSYTGAPAYEVDLNVQPFIEEGSVALAASKGSDDRVVTLDLTYASTHPDSTVVSWYFADSLSYVGHLIQREEGGDLFDDGQSGAMEATYRPDPLTAPDTLWFFAALDDGANPLQYSAIQGPFVFSPDVYGTVAEPVAGDTLAAGMLVYIDTNNDGHWDTASTGELEPHSTVSLGGGFGLSGLEAGTYTLRFLVPEGYRLAGATDGDDGIRITYAGQPLALTLALEALP